MLITVFFANHVTRQPGVYYADVKVVFLVPSSAANPNPLLSGTGGLTGVAGVIGKMVDPGAPSARVVSPLVTLADQGIRKGYSVTLPNDGGQFALNFDQPLLDVQVVGPTPTYVATTMQTLVNRIAADLSSLQSAAQVEPVNRITLSASPSSTEIFYLTGSRVRALATTIGLGVALTVAAMVFLLRQFTNIQILLRRARRCAGSEGVGVTT